MQLKCSVVSVVWLSSRLQVRKRLFFTEAFRMLEVIR